MQGENRAGRNALGEKEGSEKRAKRPGRLRCSLSPLLPLPECPPYLGVLSPPRCGEWATSLARALPPPHSTGLLPMCEVKCIAGTGRGPYREGQGNALCVSACVCIFSLSFARSSFHCGQSIAMNSCECSTTNTHSPSFRWDSFPIRAASSLFDAKPLYTPTFGLLIVFIVRAIISPVVSRVVYC